MSIDPNRRARPGRVLEGWGALRCTCWRWSTALAVEVGDAEVDEQVDGRLPGIHAPGGG